MLATQSLGLTAPALHAQFTHHLSLLTHHAAITRKESLTFLAAHLGAGAVPTALLVPRLAPLILDLSDSVRAQLLTLLAQLRPADTRIHMSLLLLHIWSAMSHIDPDIRNDSTKFLAWALAAAPAETLANGGWGKGLGALSGVLGFAADAGPRGIKGSKNIMRHLGVLKEFLVIGMGAEDEDDAATGRGERLTIGGLHWSAAVNTKCAGVGGYRYLGLFIEEVKEGGEGTGGEDKIDGRPPETKHNN